MRITKGLVNFLCGERNLVWLACQGGDKRYLPRKKITDTKVNLKSSRSTLLKLWKLKL